MPASSASRVSAAAAATRAGSCFLAAIRCSAGELRSWAVGLPRPPQLQQNVWLGRVHAGEVWQPDHCQCPVRLPAGGPQRRPPSGSSARARRSPLQVGGPDESRRIERAMLREVAWLAGWHAKRLLRQCKHRRHCRFLAAARTRPAYRCQCRPPCLQSRQRPPAAAHPARAACPAASCPRPARRCGEGRSSELVGRSQQGG